MTELVVVIAILALLLAIAIPAYTGYRERAAKQAEVANVRMLENAIMMYFADGNTGEIDWNKNNHLAEDYIKTWPEGCTVKGGPNNFVVTCGETSSTDDTTGGE